MSEIVISDRRVAVDENRYRVSFAVAGTEVDELWFDVPSEYSDWVTESFDVAVVGLLLPAMVAGKDIRVKGRLSIRLAWFLTRTAMPIMTVVQKGAVPIEITGFTPVGSADRAA